MLGGLFIASLIGTCAELFKESNQKTIPAENWANKELYHKDLMSGMSTKQIMKNVENGKYRITEKYPEPHRSKDGKIMIENSLLYREDVRKHGAYQAMQWAKQGKYNLTPEELEKEDKRLKKEYEYLYDLL